MKCVPMVGSAAILQASTKAEPFGLPVVMLLIREVRAVSALFFGEKTFLQGKNCARPLWPRAFPNVDCWETR